MLRDNNNSGVKSGYTDDTPCNLPSFLICVVMVLIIISEFILTGGSFSESDSYVALIIIQFFVYIIPSAFFSAFANHKIHSGLSDYNFRPFPPKLLGFTLLSLPIIIFGNMSIKYFDYILLGNINEATIIYESDNLLALIAATVIVPAIAEEILIRGVVFTAYENRGISPFIAIIGSSVLFAFIHFDLRNFISYVFSGIVLGILLHVTRSLIAPIIVHLLNNWVCLYTDTFIKRVSKESVSTFFVIFMLLLMFILFLFFWLESLEWICSSKSSELSKSPKQPDSEISHRIFSEKGQSAQMLKRIFVSPTFVSAFVIFIVGILLSNL